MSSNVLRSVDVENLDFLEFSLSLVLTLFLSSLLWSSLNSKGRNLMEIFHLNMSVPRLLTLFMMCGCRSLHLFPSAEGGSLSDDD